MYRFRVERQRNLGLATKIMVLSVTDYIDFIETLNNPPEPNEALKEAKTAHDELIYDEFEEQDKELAEAGIDGYHGRLVAIDEGRGLDFDIQNSYNMQGQALENRLDSQNEG